MSPDSSPQTTAGRPRKILVVDDNAVIVKTLSFKLKSAGFEVFTAADGAEAVAAARKTLPDLIVLDISFPTDVGHGGGVAWDGFLVMNWLRRIDELKHTPILVITIGDPEKYEPRAREAGAAGFFRKPLDHAALLDAIRKLLEANPGGAAAAN